MEASDFSLNARRSTRIAMRVAVRISVRNEPNTFDAWTMIVNKHGAKLECRESFATGQEMGIATFDGGTAMGKVVWSNPDPNSNNHFEFAVELAHPTNLFHVSFPPDDWKEPEGEP